MTARFTVDMTSIANEDISDAAMNAMLIAHLRSADFFDVEHHPTAQFTAAAAEKIATCTEGTPNFLLRGTFTLRGISRPLEFPVLIAAANTLQPPFGLLFSALFLCKTLSAFVPSPTVAEATVDGPGAKA